MNPILMTDSYKASHFKQYPPGTEAVYSYIEARKGGAYDEVVFFGLQAFLMKYLSRFRVTMGHIHEAEAFFAEHGEPFNREGWEIIVNDHDGYIPLEIHALPEGTVVPVGTVLATVCNADGRLPWLTSYYETLILQAAWYGSTVATVSYHVKKAILGYYRTTVDDENMGALDFALHDFGFRGVSSVESAGIGSAAHLTSFKGTDTIAGILFARRYYGENMAGFSVPAAEHSTITSWGRDAERDAYENMVDQFGGDGKIYAVVSDSYDFHNAVDNIWGSELRNKVIKKGGRLVIRPDSGYPPDMVLYALESLGEKFGYTVNSKGYRVLHPSVRVIQGDGITPAMINVILDLITMRGWSAENVVFGMGGGLLQHWNRDTLRFAMKASAICKNGTWHKVSKAPATDPTKSSKAGLVAPFLIDGQWVSKDMWEMEEYDHEMLNVYFGSLVNVQTFDEVRANVQFALEQYQEVVA